MEIALVPHLIRKDLRHLWPLFALWFFLLLAQAALIGSGFSSGPGDMVRQIIYTVLAFGIPLLQALVIVILVPLLIQDEALVGTTAFWFTRPLSRPTLLAAKTCFVTIFLVLPPLVIQTFVFAANGIRFPDILLALPEILHSSLSLILPIAALAVINRTFAKFALWLVAAWIVMAVCGTIVQLTRMALSPDSFVASAQNPSALVSTSIVSGLVSIVGSAVVIVHQYLTRRTRLSVIGLVVTLAAAIFVQAAWHYDFLKRPAVAANLAEFSPGTVTATVKKNSVFSNDTVVIGFGKNPNTDIRADLLFGNVPAGYQLDVENVKADLTFADGDVLTSEKSKGVNLRSDLWPSALSAALGGVPIRNGKSDSDEANTLLMTLDTAEFQARRNQPGILHARLDLQATKLEVIGSVPLQEGAHIDDGSRHYQISQVLHQTDGVRIIMRERKLNLWSTRSFSQFGSFDNQSPSYVLVNRSRNEAILPDRNLSVDMTSAILEGATLLVNRSVPLQFTGSRYDKEVVKVDRDWLAGAELVRIEKKNAGTLQRELTAPDFNLSPKK